jgi:hypothetical protein
LGVGWGANNHTIKKPACYEMMHRTMDLVGLFGITKARENGHEIWNTECQEFL